MLDNVLLDEQGALTRAIGPLGTPTMLFFDGNGKLVATRVGEVSTATLVEQIRGLRTRN